MYAIQRSGLLRRKIRLFGPEALTSSDFEEIALALAVAPMKARKISYVAACRSQEQKLIETKWKGESTHNTAEPGDWIVTNMSIAGKVLRDDAHRTNTYVIKSGTFEQLYARSVGETEYGPVFKAKGVVDAIFFSGGLDILAPWGERQSMVSGYLLRNGNDIYGNERETFKNTYEVL